MRNFKVKLELDGGLDICGSNRNKPRGRHN